VPQIDFLFENNTGHPLSQFAIKFNVNYLGLAPDAPLKPGTINNGASARCSLPLSDSAKAEGAPAPVQMAVKTELGVFVFQDKVPAYCLFADSGTLPRQTFLSMWSAIPDTNEVVAQVPARTTRDVEAVKSRMGSGNVFFVASPKNTVDPTVYCSLSLKGVPFLVEIKLLAGTAANIAVRSENPTLSAVVLGSVVDLITSQ